MLLAGGAADAVGWGRARAAVGAAPATVEVAGARTGTLLSVDEASALERLALVEALGAFEAARCGLSIKLSPATTSKPCSAASATKKIAAGMLTPVRVLPNTARRTLARLSSGGRRLVCAGGCAGA